MTLGAAGDFNLLRSGADVQAEIETRALGYVETDVVGDGGLKAGRLHFDAVSSRRKLGDDIFAAFGIVHGADEAGAVLRDGDRSVWHDGAGFIR
jgi:hypothetical protein